MTTTREDAATQEATRARVSPKPAGAMWLRQALEQSPFLLVVLGVCCAVQAWWARGEVASDGWYTLLSGRKISRSGLPHHDTLTTLTLGHTWVDEQWLAHLGLYGIWAAGGWRLCALAVVAMYLAALAIGAIAARHAGASDRGVAMVLIVCFAAGLSNTVFRAQIPAYVLFELVLVLLLSDARRPTRRVYLALPLLVLWANLHGSVVVGAALVALRGLTIAGERLIARRPPREWVPRAAVLVGAPWLCILVSPYGLALPHYYESVLDNPALSSSVSEWGPTTLRTDPIFFALLLPAIWIAGRSRGATSVFSRLALAGCGVLGLYAVRNQVWFALAGAAILPAMLDGCWPAPLAAPRRHRVNRALVAIVALSALAGLAATAAHGNGWFERSYPARAEATVAAAAAAEPGLRVFANERYADWLLFEDPALTGRVAYDIRFELLTQAQIDTIVDFRAEAGLDWERAANGYGLLVLDPSSDAGAIKLFREQAGTKVLFRDSHVVVLQRKLATGTS